MTTIRPLQTTDRARWDELFRGYLTFYETELPAATYDETWRRLMSADEDPQGFGAVDDAGTLVGIVHFLYHRSTWDVADKCYLQDLFVAPDHRRGGAGEALMRAVFEAACADGAGEVYWMTQHFNDTALRLYDRIGELTPFIKYRWK